MGSAAFYLYIPVPVSKQDLKHFSKSDLPGFASGVFYGFQLLFNDFEILVNDQVAV